MISSIDSHEYWAFIALVDHQNYNMDGGLYVKEGSPVRDETELIAEQLADDFDNRATHLGADITKILRALQSAGYTRL
jgi:hypothetical protein